MQKECEIEKQVVKMLKSNSNDPEIYLHMQSCETCRETAKIIEFLNTSKERDQLPTAGFIWWKSRLRQRRRAAENVTKPIRIVQAVTILIAFLSFVGLFIADYLQDSLIASALGRVLNSLESLASAFITGIIGFVIISIIVMLIFRRDLTRE